MTFSQVIIIHWEVHQAGRVEFIALSVLEDHSIVEREYFSILPRFSVHKDVGVVKMIPKPKRPLCSLFLLLLFVCFYFPIK